MGCGRRSPISRAQCWPARRDDGADLTAAMRQPIHTLYGGAHLFRSGVCRKMGDHALRLLDEQAIEACGVDRSLVDAVHARVAQKLRGEPVEDLRIDFEDGYGVRSDEEEDRAALTVAEELAKGALPAFIGIRIKMGERGARTLRLVLRNLRPLPENFTVTIPNIMSIGQVRAAADLAGEFGVKRLELMIETPQSVLLLPELAGAARGLLSGLHFGAYDYTAALGIAAPHQDMLHPACDLARSLMQLHFAGSTVQLSDGATNILPIGDAARRGWEIHSRHIRHSLANGFYQSWDLHPAQLVSRYATVYSFFLEGLEESAKRLRNFIEVSAQATRVGGVFDDAATGRGLVNYFERAVQCGAIDESRVRELTGYGLQELTRWS